MRKSTNIKICLAATVMCALTITGCKKDFLEKLNKIDLTEQTALVTTDNFRAYAWGLYDYFDGYGNQAQYPNSLQSSEFNSDNISLTASGAQSPYVLQTKTYPTTANATGS